MADDPKAAVMQAQIEATAELVADIALHVSQIDNALRGNGRRGLFTKHEILETRVASLEEFTSEIKALRRWVFTGVVALVGSVVWSATQVYLRTQ
jgi:gluconate kinase